MKERFHNSNIAGFLGAFAGLSLALISVNFLIPEPNSADSSKGLYKDSAVEIHLEEVRSQIETKASVPITLASLESFSFSEPKLFVEQVRSLENEILAPKPSHLEFQSVSWHWEKEFLRFAIALNP